ncbi:hypothetical protein [Rhizobium sp. SGZ-381]|uniref:DUF7146 domain-containing protein n=1 Tax=Rhizobium sp. SGZ-381 TaxID=3342800 RepID=UPI00366F7D3C
MTTILDEFILRAKTVDFARACDILKIPQAAKGKSEYQGPCPQPGCGGVDRFSVNRGKGVWNCRGCGLGGRDGLSLAAHVLLLDLRNRAGFLEACSALLCEEIPKEGERETDEERAEREARIAQAQADLDRQTSEKQEERNAHRDREIMRARGLWLEAADCLSGTNVAVFGRGVIRDYLKARTGFLVPETLFENARFRPSAGYYKGEDRAGRPLSIYSGPAMILPIVNPEARIIGCHQTWIDLICPEGKYRPILYGLTKKGQEAGYDVVTDHRRQAPSAELIEAGFYERLASKKMRGVKKGGIVPLIGQPELLRWAGGEGIENVVAFAGAEGFRADTFYFTSGDLGNLAGPAEPASAFMHPELTYTDTLGRVRKVKVPGPVPKARQGPDDAMQVADHVAELLLLADGDSEPVFTASAMARALARLSRPGLLPQVIWPPEGMDFSGALSAALNKGGV